MRALLFLDADGLKVVNDRFGHAAGDEMLVALADILRSQLRSADLIARIGGDEFVVLLSSDSVLESTGVIERLRAAAANRNTNDDRRYSLDFSVGVAYFEPLHPLSVDELIRQADAAMYEEKRTKRSARSPT
jgi:diguanylate cyclase (GGDEF)-like protein